MSPEIFLLLTVFIEDELRKCAVHVRDINDLPESLDTVRYWKEPQNAKALVNLTPWDETGVLVGCEEIQAVSIVTATEAVQHKRWLDRPTVWRLHCAIEGVEDGEALQDHGYVEYCNAWIPGLWRSLCEEMDRLEGGAQ